MSPDAVADDDEAADDDAGADDVDDPAPDDVDEPPLVPPPQPARANAGTAQAAAIHRAARLFMVRLPVGAAAGTRRSPPQTPPGGEWFTLE